MPSVLGLGVSSKHLRLLEPIFGSIRWRAEKLLAASCLQDDFSQLWPLSPHITMFKKGRRKRWSGKEGPCLIWRQLLSRYPSVNVFSGLIGQDRVRRSPLVAREAGNKPSLLLSWSFFLLISVLRTFFLQTLEWLAPSSHIVLCSYLIFDLLNLLYHSLCS